MKPSKKRRKVVKPAEPEKPRKDNSLKHVIINESHDRKAAKHQVCVCVCERERVCVCVCVCV